MDISARATDNISLVGTSGIHPGYFAAKYLIRTGIRSGSSSTKAYRRDHKQYVFGSDHLAQAAATAIVALQISNLAFVQTEFLPVLW
jgi:hypothetical protein